MTSTEALEQVPLQQRLLLATEKIVERDNIVMPFGIASFESAWTTPYGSISLEDVEVAEDAGTSWGYRVKKSTITDLVTGLQITVEAGEPTFDVEDDYFYITVFSALERYLRSHPHYECLGDYRRQRQAQLQQAAERRAKSVEGYKDTDKRQSA